MHHIFNNIPFAEMDNMHITGSKPINTIVVTPNIMECIEGCKLFEANKIIITDHQSYVVDINFKRYFQAQLSYWDKINQRIIDPARRSHREGFCKIVEEQIDLFKIEREV